MIIKDLLTQGEEEFILVGASTSFSDLKWPQTISLMNAGELLGTLDYSGPELTFSGKADEAAKAFFDSLIVCHSTFIKDLQSQIETLKQGKS